MKIVNYSFFISIFFLSYNLLAQQYYCYPRTYQQPYLNLGQQLLAAAKTNTPEKFRTLLNQAAQQYKGNSRNFFEILDMRNGDGLNIIQLATLTGDLENLETILNTLENFYGSDIQGIFQYLTTQDKRGLSLLALAEYLGNRRVFEILLIRVMSMLRGNKKMFFIFLNLSTKNYDWLPLAYATYDNESKNVEMMVKLAAYVLGRNSTFFKTFINQSDKDGYNALSYADNPQIKFLLLDYGAQLPKVQIKITQNPLLPTVLKYGQDLNIASNQGNFLLFQHILSHSYEFKDNPNLLYFFFSSRNGGGWNPFINTAADGQYNYIKLLVETMDNVFPKSYQHDETMGLLSNADFEGRTALHLAIARRHFHVAKFIIETSIRYSYNKSYAFAQLNTPNDLNGFTPLINAVYAAEEFDKEMYDFIKYFIEKMIELFGRDSRIFYLFLNTREYNNWTPLSYATDPKLIKLLKSYGAIDKPMKHYKGALVYLII